MTLDDLLEELATAPTRAALEAYWRANGMREAALLHLAGDREAYAAAWHAFQKARDAFDAPTEVA